MVCKNSHQLFLFCMLKTTGATPSILGALVRITYLYWTLMDKTPNQQENQNRRTCSGNFFFKLVL